MSELEEFKQKLQAALSTIATKYNVPSDITAELLDLLGIKPPQKRGFLALDIAGWTVDGSEVYIEDIFDDIKYDLEKAIGDILTGLGAEVGPKFKVSFNDGWLKDSLKHFTI